MLKPATNWYEILCISPDANKIQINKAFRKLAHQFHPDKNPYKENANEQFQLIKEAYQILSDEVLRAAFDKQLSLNTNNQYQYYQNAQELIAAVKKLNAEIQLQNIFFIDRDLLLFQLLTFISKNNLQLLQSNLNGVYVELMLQEQFNLAKYLPFKICTPLFKNWISITNNNAILKKQVESFIQKKRMNHLWEIIKPIMAILLSIIIVTFIYLSQQ